MKMLMAKLKIQPDTMEPLNDELNMEIANDIIWGNPDFKRKLKSVLKSKKWAYKSWHLYSPHIQNEGDYQYDFMRINKNLATNGASTNFEFPLWTMDSSKNPIEISRFANLANEFPLYAIDTSKMMKVLGYIKNFTPYDEELLHNLAMCNKSVFIYVQKNNPSSPNGKSKKGQQTMVYLYKKLFSFIEDLISKQDGPYDDEMTQGMHELSTQSRLKDDGAEDIQRPGEERLEQHAPLRNATSEPLVNFFPLKNRKQFLKRVKRKFVFGTKMRISRQFTTTFVISMMSTRAQFLIEIGIQKKDRSWAGLAFHTLSLWSIKQQFII